MNLPRWFALVSRIIKTQIFSPFQQNSIIFTLRVLFPEGTWFPISSPTTLIGNMLVGFFLGKSNLGFDKHQTKIKNIFHYHWNHFLVEQVLKYWRKIEIILELWGSKKSSYVFCCVICASFYLTWWRHSSKKDGCCFLNSWNAPDINF